MKLVIEILMSLVKEELSTQPTQVNPVHLSLPVFPQSLTSVNKYIRNTHKIKTEWKGVGGEGKNAGLAVRVPF